MAFLLRISKTEPEYAQLGISSKWPIERVTVGTRITRLVCMITKQIPLHYGGQEKENVVKVH